MKNRLSNSQIRMYSECGKKYKLHYVDRLRSTMIHGALIFGSAIDRALNHLLETKDLKASIQLFDKSFRFQSINNEPTYIPSSTNVVYSQRDFDKDLLQPEDIVKYRELKEKLGMGNESNPADDLSYFMKIKKESGIKALSFEERKLYAYSNWLSMRRKGHIMIESYNKKVLPKIKNVLAIQKGIEIKNTDGDSITGFLDLIVEWEDGKRYLLDNKTSAMKYESDSAMRSQQLILYYYAEKETYKLDGVGFIVMYKNIDKNKIKICSQCGKDGTGQRHKTCDNEILDTNNGAPVMTAKRCNGEWMETISPEAIIETILNPISEAAESLVLEAFDEANFGIKNQTFNPNLQACGNENFKCQYFNKCWLGSDEDLIVLEKKETKDV